MTFHIGITDDGTAKILIDKFIASGERAVDIQPILEIISLEMMDITNTNFTSEGRRGGGSWKRLAPSTIDKKGSSQILVDTGDLVESLTEPDHSMQILNIGLESIEYGTERPWAFVHQHGRRDQSIPARPFLRFLPTDAAKWRDQIGDYILRPFRTSE